MKTKTKLPVRMGNTLRM